ncbi:hypothetical protein ACEWK1_14090 [Metabacillus sp. YM-086]
MSVRNNDTVLIGVVNVVDSFIRMINETRNKENNHEIISPNWDYMLD